MTALPARWTIHAYECADAPTGLTAVAHLFEKRSGRVDAGVFSLHTATAFGPTCHDASARLTAFLQAEIAAESKRRANAKAFGDRVRLRAAKSP